jgi:hypothetical protein
MYPISTQGDLGKTTWGNPAYELKGSHIRLTYEEDGWGRCGKYGKTPMNMT